MKLKLIGKNYIMTTKEITELELGTTVYLIVNGNIQAWETLRFHPKYKYYFYLSGHGSIAKTKCLFLDAPYYSEVHSFRWETSYEEAKEVMWEQLKRNMDTVNKVYMDGKKSLNLE